MPEATQFSSSSRLGCRNIHNDDATVIFVCWWHLLYLNYSCCTDSIGCYYNSFDLRCRTLPNYQDLSVKLEGIAKRQTVLCHRLVLEFSAFYFQLYFGGR